MFPPRRFPHVVTALFLIAGGFLVYLFSTADSRAEGSFATCADASEFAVLPSPIAPWTGAPLRVLVVAEKPLEGELSLIAPDGRIAAKSPNRHGGPPYFWYVEIASPTAGKWHETLARNREPAGCRTITREIAVRNDQLPPPRATPGSVWPLRNTWNRVTENLYSAWIEKLFDAPLDAELSWPALDKVLRDRSRNFLFDYLSLGEDEMGLILRPDCAKLPYLLRAYFAFKMGLPFGYSKCTRGGGGQPPRCREWWNIENPEPPRAAPEEEIAAAPIEMARLPGVPLRAPTAPPRPVASPASKLAFLFPRLAATTGSAGMMSEPRPLGLAQLFGLYVGSIVADGVHSGSGRTALADNNTDYYPVALNQDELRPGTVYADPYGHMLVLVRRVPQSAGAAGVFLAVDAQPDATVSRKRFWRGNFLFAQDPALGGPGFKRFRPIVREKSGALRRLTNEEIAKNPQYGDFALDQGRLAIEDFYDRMDDVMSPAPLDPLRAMQEAITSLEEQVKARVISVENGRKYQASGRDASMPEGAAIFETTGAWEDFATPARDLRLLIAMDVVHTFPDRVMRRPERYAMPSGKSLANVKAELERVLASELAARKFTYTRSDGSAWTLALKDVIDRMPDLEMAYNVNDCVELRWGATASSTEAATCKRHAPMAQRGKMTEYRAWFHERRRPPRA